MAMNRGPIPAQLTAPGNAPAANNRGRGIGVLGAALARMDARRGELQAPGLGGLPPGLQGQMPPGLGGAMPTNAMGGGPPMMPPPGLGGAMPVQSMAPPVVPPAPVAPIAPAGPMGNPGQPRRMFPPGMTVNGRRGY